MVCRICFCCSKCKLATKQIGIYQILDWTRFSGCSCGWAWAFTGGKWKYCSKSAALPICTAADPLLYPSVQQQSSIAVLQSQQSGGLAPARHPKCKWHGAWRHVPEHKLKKLKIQQNLAKAFEVTSANGVLVVHSNMIASQYEICYTSSFEDLNKPSTIY